MKRLGALTDAPMAILETAKKELQAAFSPLDVRQAAEKAHLALSSSVEIALRKEIKSASEERLGVQTIAKWLRDPDVETDFMELRRVLHSRCFHADKCPTVPALLVTFGKAEALMERIIKSRKRRNT